MTKHHEESHEEMAFWGDARAIAQVHITLKPPPKPLATLEKLGPSPFERGRFPLIGFLATTYDKVSQFALERGGYQSPDAADSPSTDIPNA
jgi:hypothetical protein